MCGSVMEINEKVIFLTDVDDGTSVNPQSGWFVVRSVVGPFQTSDNAHEYLINVDPETSMDDFEET